MEMAATLGLNKNNIRDEEKNQGILKGEVSLYH